MFRLTKRRKFILSSLILSAGLLVIQSGGVTGRYLAIAILSFLTIPLVIWSLSEALTLPILLTSWILPFSFTAGVGMFYFLLPGTLFTALPIIILYFLGLYALFLSENIFSVAALRTIQLFRSAWAVSFLLTLLILFLLYDTIFSFRLPFYYNFIFIFIISFFIFFHGTWSVNLQERITGEIVVYSLILSLGVAQTGLILSFWPASITLNSLFLTAIVYVSLGLVQAKLSDRLFEKTVREYLLVGISVFLILLFYTTWG